MKRVLKLLAISLLLSWVLAQGVQYHIVVRGDTLTRLAARYNTTVSTLQRLNSLPGDSIREGQRLQVTGAPTDSTAFRLHEVTAGETLTSIARLYGLSEESLIGFNQELSSTRGETGFAPGTRLRVPSGPGVVVRVTPQQDLLVLALQHNIEPRTLARANGFDSLSAVRNEQLIFIPSAVATERSGRRESLIAQQRTLMNRAPQLLSSYVAPRPPQQPPATVGTTAGVIPVGTGGYAWPLTVRGRVSSPFGQRNLSVGGNTFHGGLDIAAPTGTPIVASRAGVVTRAEWVGAYGYAVFVDHGDGAQTRYAHMSQMSVTPGTRVVQGQRLGLVGSTGASTGPHLHFEVRLAGRAVDPAPYLR